MNPSLRPLAFLVGTWRTCGTHPMVPAKTFHGRTSFDWHEGGAFLIMHSEIDEPEIPSGVAIFGSDNGVGTMSMLYFDERGVSRHYAVEAGDRTVTWSRDDPNFRQTQTITAGTGGATLESRGRMARGGGAWEDDLSLTYTREP
ncbi:MAG TPA: hypothetical protein VGX37_03150 [Allosphingosinicella sp.]|nr:hypothetical protein [Allosphingosinicella sp.]